ncbi:MAG: fibronectin type III domain-containing protein [Bacteroidales bacterium]|nr:fibronectin type III domain-containing protein [Bacteroidales bacterium]
MRFKIVVLIALCAFVCESCLKDAKPNGETIQIIKEKEKITVGADCATIRGEYAYSGAVDGMKLRMGTEEHLYGSDDYHITVSGKTYSVEVNGLQPGTMYYYAYLVDYGSRTDWQSEIYGFTTSEEEINLPTVATVEVTGVTVTTASCLCHVSDDGGADVTERGVCWSTTLQPDISDFVYANGNGIGEYSVSMVDLEANTTYYVRAYAKNRKGVNYGEALSFTTLENLEPPLGASNGVFSVAEDRQVWFALGNLQYLASTNSWTFAENAYDYIGNDNTNIAEDYDGWIDLFGWGTSGYNHGAVCYQPWSSNSIPECYYAYGDRQANLYENTGQADWGYNKMPNEGEEGKWRTLTRSEWNYVLEERNTLSGIRYAKAQVCGVNGLILLPDNWSNSVYYLNNVNLPQASFSSNMITAGWDFYLEGNGAVFLPAAGFREEDEVDYVGSRGFYFTSECTGSRAFCVCFDYTEVGLMTMFRNRGLSVRLVRDVERQ